MPKPQASVTPKTPLREQLCQIEQSLGVCHVAEVTPWPDLRGRPPGPPAHYAMAPSPRSSLPACGISPTSEPSPFRSALPRLGIPASRFGESSRNDKPSDFDRPAVHQPQLQRRPGNGLTRSSRVPRQVAHDDFGLDDTISRRLDDAVSQLVDGVADHSPIGEARCGQIIALGAPQATAACGRLPQQLADLRLHLRKLGSYCDSMQTTTAHSAAVRGPPCDVDDETTLENMEHVHASVMQQARLLLENIGSQNPPPSDAPHSDGAEFVMGRSVA